MHLRQLRFTLLFIALLLTVSGTPCLAQVGGTPFRCQTLSSNPAHLRSEGYTELIGDILLSCSGGAPTPLGAPIPQANITIVLNTNITSRILGNNGSEALLLLDDPGSVQNPRQQLCGSLSGCVVAGTGGAGEPFSGTDATRPNIFQGIVSGNSVTFFGIPIDPPGAARNRAFRITNIRANATALPVGALQQVMAFIGSNPPASVPIDNAAVPVGFVFSGISFSSGIFSIPACTGLTDLNRFAVATFSEGFVTAFKPRTSFGPLPPPQNIPGPIAFNTESGFGFTGLPGAGLADAGTRLKTIMRNIPAGVNVWVSTSSFGASPTSAAVLVASETGPYSPVVSTTQLLNVDVAQLPVVNGTATAVWEVTASDPSVTDSFSFEVILTSANSGPPSTSSSPMTANGSLAPVPPIFSAADAVKAQPAPFPVPRFADTSVVLNILTVAPCTTSLLFPYVTTLAGFDTGVAISSTSKDPLGTTPESGPCTLSFFGSHAPPAFTTPTIAAGTTYTNVMSTLSPNFQGYLIAVCNFQFAHGAAFISDAGARNLAMAYLALVVPNPRSVVDVVSTENLLH